MFGSTFSVLKISEDTVSLATYNRSGELMGTPITKPVTPESRIATLTELKKNCEKQLFIELNDVYFYTVTAKIPKTEPKKNPFDTLIPEESSTLLKKEQSLEIGNDFYTSLTALTTLGKELIRSISNDAGISVKMVFPRSSVLAASIPDDTVPTLLISENVICVISHKMVLETHLFSKKSDTILIDTIESILARFEMITICFYDGVLSTKTEELFKEHHIIPKKMSFPLYASIANANSVQIPTEKDEVPEQNTPDSSKKLPIKKILIGSAGVLTVAIVLVNLLTAKPQPQETKKVFITPTVEMPTPTKPESKPLSDYSFQIQNGSGITGQAAKVAALLKQSNITKVTTKNADSADYTKTEVISVTPVSDDMKKSLDTVLSGIYTDLVYKTVSASTEAEIIIILGKN